MSVDRRYAHIIIRKISKSPLCAVIKHQKKFSSTRSKVEVSKLQNYNSEASPVMPMVLFSVTAGDKSNKSNEIYQ